MTIIKLDAIDSTNSYLKRISAENELNNYTVVVSKEQTAGRGQMGAVWSSQPYKNLTFSIYLDVSNLVKEKQFYISMIVSLSILKALQIIGIPNLKIKWPNDILSANNKIGGVLIENIIKQNELYASIIGIGLNINQTSFENLPRASSLKSITGKSFDHEEVLYQIIDQLKKYSLAINENDFNVVLNQYQEHLYRINKPSTFKKEKGTIVMGFIKGVSDSGKIKILLEDDILQEFELKELQLLY